MGFAEPLLDLYPLWLSQALLVTIAESLALKEKQIRRIIIKFNPIPFIGGPRHGKLWNPESTRAREQFVKLHSPNGDTYVRKAYKVASGDIIELWIFADLQLIVDDLGAILGFNKNTK